ncbi:MAG: hypothetical protein NDI69_16235 [Bacteriovoracaceae bacterium]|nr:hypothetical protein [Bacteriovoracaceae bacterium]
MLQSFFKIALVLGINLIISIPIYAKTVEQKELNFPIKTEDLMKDEIHYYFTVLSPRKLVLAYPELFDLDSLSLIQESNVMMVVNKSVSVVNRPVGFFEEKQMNDETFVSHIMGEQKVKSAGPGIFSITVPGEDQLKYRMQSFFDSDDLSTLPNSKVTMAVSAAKKLDVIAQGASTIMFTEKTQFSKYAEGAVTVSSYIPLKENKTLIISYQLWAIKKASLDKKELKLNFVGELEAVKSLIESYK